MTIATDQNYHDGVLKDRNSDDDVAHWADNYLYAGSFDVTQSSPFTRFWPVTFQLLKAARTPHQTSLEGKESITQGYFLLICCFLFIRCLLLRHVFLQC